LLGIAGRAFQIAEWARTHRYCGACGTPTANVSGERCFKCLSCGHPSYPRVSPAMMTLVQRGDSILLARHVGSPRYTALAGFLEAGESIEDAIHREVYEEVGLHVTDLRYFASQSWPFPHSLMIAFTAQYAGGELALDAKEIAEARWFGPGDEIPEIPSGVSIAAALIDAHRPRRR
jgi:NAD+ diphosphatase